MPTDLHSQPLADLFRHLTPEMILGGLACLLFLGGTWKANRALWAVVTLAGIAAAGFMLWHQPSGESPTPVMIYGTPLVFDSLTSLIRWIALGAGVVFTLFAWSEVPERQASDFFACLVIMVAGTSLTAAANDLVLLFLALELVSIPTYVMLYLPRHDKNAQEAAIKYFLLSIFSSALMLFGFSYLYGLTGTTNIAALENALNGSTEAIPPIGLVALIMVVAGLGFRITAVPFHFYAPDVFQGTATIMASILAFIPKVVGFVALVRVLGFVLPPGTLPRQGIIGQTLSEHMPVLFWFLAVVTMSLGNLLALLQDNPRRLLAYSSVAHAGYMLMALATAPFLPRDGSQLAGVSSLFFYLIAYGAMTTGAFAVLSYLETADGKRIESVDELAGLGSSKPGLALLMVIFLFSLIGIPLTAGFAGKFLIFFGAMAVPSPEHAKLYRVLALIGVVNASIGGWYYLRMVAIMYLRQAIEPLTPRRSLAGLATLLICGALTLGLGLPPGVDWLMSKANEAVER